MISRDTFVYYIFNKDKKALYVDEVTGQVLVADDNHLKPDGTPARLLHAPAGWENTSVKYARNEFYLGLHRDFTTSLTFHKDALEIVKALFKDYGYEAIGYLGIAKLDFYSLPYKYTSWHLTELDFTKYEKDLTGGKLAALEGGPSKYLKANENTVYEIDLGLDAQKKKYLAEGIKFDFSRTFEVQNESVMYAVPNYYLGMFSSVFEGLAPQVVFSDVFFKKSSVYPNNDWFLNPTQLVEVRVHGKVVMYYNEDDAFELRVEVNDGVNPGTTNHVLVPSASGTGLQDETKEFTFDSTFTIPANYRAHMKVFTTSNVGGVPQITIQGGEVIVDYLYQHESTYVDGMFAMRLFDRLVDKMTGGLYQAQSSWLTTTQDILYTCGEALRGIEESKIKISFRDFFNSLRFAGLGVKGDKIIIEQLNYFFDNTQTVITLGDVKDAKLSVAESLVGNLIKAGYEKQDYEDVNGRSEFNQGQTWSTPVTKILREINKVSPVRADAIGAELIRIDYYNKKTTDSKGDNDTFKIHIDTTVYNDPTVGDYYKYYRVVYDTVTGLNNWETYFNLELSPKKELLKAGRLLRSLLDKMDSDYIKLESADKNKDMVLTIGTSVFTEADPVQIGAMGDKLFLPYYFNFTTEVPVNLLAVMEANAYGKVKFKWKDIDWYGYFWDGAVKPGDNDTQTWKLIACPENDLSKF